MNDENLKLIYGDARHVPLEDKTVQCIVTSPPYWGLRKYAGEQELIWGGATDCRHEWKMETRTIDNNNGNGSDTAKMAFNVGDRYAKQSIGACLLCGAWCGAYGLEPTIEMYVAHTVEILRECRRVLRLDGVCFWNVGDSYAGSWSRSGNPGGKGGLSEMQVSNAGSYSVESACPVTPPGLKPKDLCLIPARVAIAAQADGWWVRSMIIWAKPNPMPESCTDRPTDAYEHILMLTKSERYYWDADAVREPAIQGDRVRSDVVGGNRSSILQHSPGGKFTQGQQFGYTPKGTHSRGSGDGGPKARLRAADGVHENWAESTREVLGYRNLRNVWMFATQPYSGAHFATFPEELPRRCILAATSARGACIQCGAPWERVLRRQFYGDWNPHPGSSVATVVNRQTADRKGNDFIESWKPPEIIGWRPTCLCPGQHGKTAPCLVLDPFGGSGTTGRVALELRRRAVLVDIAYNAEYRELAERRTSGVNVKLPFS